VKRSHEHLLGLYNNLNVDLADKSLVTECRLLIILKVRANYWLAKLSRSYNRSLMLGSLSF